MKIHKLAPRPGGVVVSTAPKALAVLTHSDAEWAALRPDIERLYVRERRKLRFVMQYMESKHSFKATEQMYKKRFAKWNFLKNSKSSGTTVNPLKAKDEDKILARRMASARRYLGSMVISPSLDRYDGPALMFLTSVRTWSVSFFESVQYCNGASASKQQLSRLALVKPQPSRTKEINFAFKLVIDMLDRGHGDIAGRMARKAFLLVEDMLTLEGPALVWNMLEMMHYMLTLRHAQLFHILLAYLIELVNGRIPATHPLPAMLRSLQGLVASLTSKESIPKSSSPFSSSSSSVSSSSSSSDETITIGIFPFLLQQAWILNAEVLFTRFDPHLFHLYFGILWESCSIAPPPAILGATQGWFGKIEAQQALPARTAAQRFKKLGSLEEEKLSLRVPALRANASPLRDYKMLRADCIAVLGDQWDAILSRGAGFNGDTSVMLRLLAGLGTAKLLDESPVVTRPSNATTPDTTMIPRFDAGNVACMIRAVVDLNAEQSGGELGASLKAIERIRAIVALSGYAEGETYPQVVRDMWLLQDALAAAGEPEEAGEVEQDAFRRIERYIHDIPVAST